MKVCHIAVDSILSIHKLLITIEYYHLAPVYILYHLLGEDQPILRRQKARIGLQKHYHHLVITLAVKHSRHDTLTDGYALAQLVSQEFGGSARHLHCHAMQNNRQRIILRIFAWQQRDSRFCCYRQTGIISTPLACQVFLSISEFSI